MKDYYLLTKEQVLSQFDVTLQGHSKEKAEKILLEKGANVLLEGKRKSTLEVFLSQFADLLVIILIIAAVISMVSGNVESTIVIFAVIIMNAVLGTVQHKKAEKSLDSLKSLSSPNAKVIRDGQKIEIPSRDVVPGDIVILEAGDMVVADGRILENFSLQVNESSLTGESTNVDKNNLEISCEVPLADRTNMVYSGTLVTYGRAEVLVTGTGMETEMGKIANLLDNEEEGQTPLQKKLAQLGKYLGIVAIAACAIIFVVGLANGIPALEIFMTAYKNADTNANPTMPLKLNNAMTYITVANNFTRGSNLCNTESAG